MEAYKKPVISKTVPWVGWLGWWLAQAQPELRNNEPQLNPTQTLTRGTQPNLIFLSSN